MPWPILNLGQLSDSALFETMSEGMALIVDNAVGLDETASRLYRDGDFRGSDIMRGFAEEEAAKVLILLDYVRCPRTSKQRVQVLKRFYGHVAKRIHAMACDYPNIASFDELSQLVESECRPWYLDGPNWVDWIFPNSISEKRTRDLYVDYVRDVTDVSGAYHWVAPVRPIPFRSSYLASDCVTLVRSLSGVGALSIAGLADIAHVWRGFAPTSDTDRRQLRRLIGKTLDRLTPLGASPDVQALRFIVSRWPFPLWPLTIKEPRPDDGDLDGLREERERTIKWIADTEAKRDPAPAISRPKVHNLNGAYAAWQSEVDAREARVRQADDQQRTFLFRSAADLEEDFRLTSYVFLQDLFRELTGEERAALLALGWFAREQVADWPRIYERATKLEPTIDEDYQISYACYWLRGLERWEEKPKPFQPGRLPWRRRS